MTSTQAAHAADDVTLQEVRELKARLKMLEQRLDAQQVQVKKQSAMFKNVPVANATPVAYAPPVPWDKKIHMNGITITPGGFLALEGVWRSRDEGADIGDAPYGSVPFTNNSLAHTNEFRFSARQSRVSALIQGAYNPSTLISGYGELDFLGAANTANSSESNSYNPRIRHLYAAVDWNELGLHAVAGQTWSLATMFAKGLEVRNEYLPLTIDTQYLAGMTWARQPGLRLVKDFGNDFSIGVAAELSQTRGCPSAFAANTGETNLGPTAVNPGVDVTCYQVTAGGGVLNQYYAYSLNHIPDFIAKAAWDPTVGDRKVHFEAFGMYTNLYDRVSYANGVAAAGTAGSTNVNKDTTGWGAGGSVLLPVIPKRFDLQGTAMVGRGIGRYGSAQLADATTNADGSLGALPEIRLMGGATFHATPALDFYLNGGLEQITNRKTYEIGGVYYGYASPLANNSGCYSDFGTCAGATKSTWEVTGGLWDKVYEGDFGSLRVGLQYAYIQRELFPGSANAASAALGSPKVVEQTARASLRYYPFDVPPPAPPLAAKY